MNNRLFQCILSVALFPLFSFSVATAAAAEFLSLPVQSPAALEPASAKLGFLEACEERSLEILNSRVAEFILTARCSEGALLEKLNAVVATGSLELQFKRPLLLETRLFETGFCANEAQARTLFDKLCKSWKLSTPSRRAPLTLFESCGTGELDRFYEKPSITSLAFRISKVRTNHRRNDYCQCRTRAIRTVTQDPWGDEVVSHRYVHDLMVLLDEGYYDLRSTHASREECSDAMNKDSDCADAN